MRYGKLFIGLFTVLFLVVAVIFGKSEYAWDGTVSISVEVTSQGKTEQITCWEEDDGKYYIFLPGYADLSQVRLRTNTINAVYLENERIKDGMTCGAYQLGVPYDLCYMAKNGENHFNLTFVQSGNVPTMYIDTASGSMEHIHEIKGNEEPGTMRLYTEHGELNHMDNLESIKGRGNSTWERRKKPYNLTLKSGGDLLGMGTAQRWVLLANAMDDSQIKNKLAYDLAEDLGLAYSPDSEWVDLYLNGEYAGLYLLCERNEVHSERVAIGEGSFLVAKDWEWRFEDEGYSFVTTAANAALRIHYSNMPETAVQEILQSAENAILAEDGIDPVMGKHWRELIDVDSWAKKYLVEEVLGNVDASTLSQFFYYDGDKVYAGPVWDFDLSLGSAEAEWPGMPNMFFGNKPNVWGSTWFYALYNDAEFYDRVTQLYETELRPLLTELLEGGIDAYGDRVGQAAKTNQLRWDAENAQTEQEAIEAYLRRRMAFLDSAWTKQEEYVIVTVKDRYDTKNCFALRPGECLPELPVYESDETTIFHGWFYRDSHLPFDPAQPIYEDAQIEQWIEIIE